MLRFFNTLTRSVDEFYPVEEGKVRMYICGPTVWNFAHIGNFRTFIFGDILRRYLKYKGYDVTHVFNLTDIDDRPLINPLRQEAFGETRPASTLVEVPRLAVDGAKVEIECVALVPK